MKQLKKCDIFPDVLFHSRRTRLAEGAPFSSPHCHDFYEVLIVEEGLLLHHVNGRCDTLYPDTLVLIRPEDQHFFSRKDKGAVQFYNLAFDGQQFARAKAMMAACTPAEGEPTLADTVVLPHDLSRILLRRMKWLQAPHPQTPPALQEAEGLTLLTEILTLCAVGSGSTHTVPFWLRRACDAMYLPENMVGGIPRLVELSGKTQEHLTRSMRKYMGLSPSAFVNALRLERAAEALASGNRPVLDIMLDVGFQNASHFNKLFKEKYQVSPRKYRALSATLLGQAE